MGGEEVPDITPAGSDGSSSPPPVFTCPMMDAVEEKRKDALMAAWAGVVVAILGILSWNTYGFLACGVGAIVFGLYARPFAPMEANADFVAGGMLLAILVLRFAGVL